FGQERSTVNLRRAMDRGEIVLVDGSGCGPDELKLLLGLFVVRFHFAALSRADTPPGARRPFLLFCDEVHNYAVPTIEKILAEDRKYGLGLVLATQYLEQMPQDVLGAIMGNVNTVWLLQLGAPSAQAMARWLKPDFAEHDLCNQPQFCAAVRTVGPDGSSVSFTVRCDPVGDGDEGVRRRALAASDARDGRDAAEVEAEVEARLSGRRPEPADLPRECRGRGGARARGRRGGGAP
ncbi:MAG: type IV secretory system conjugative DNA transfer family protein, partial [Actinomycetota bacterium]